MHGRYANEIALPTMQGWFALRKLRPHQFDGLYITRTEVAHRGILKVR